MLVTDTGKLIRTPVAGIRIAGRSTQGVIVLNTHEDERVVSVERLSEEGGEEAPTMSCRWIPGPRAEPVIGPAFGQAVGACPGMTGC